MAVTLDQVRAYVDLAPVSVLPDSTIQLFLDQAQLIIDEDLSSATFSSARVDAILLNLAAHFAVLSQEKGGFTQNQIGESMERYRNLSDKRYGIGSTRFGEAAIALDSSGTLAALAFPPLRARFQVV
jgi:hypothetical protein